MGRNYNEISGMTFGELTVLKIYKRGSSGKPVVWECLCSCGKTTYLDSSVLKSGHTKSCGHLASEVASKVHKKYNEFEFEENICYGKISDNLYFLIDKEDYDLIKKYKWGMDVGEHLYKTKYTGRDIKTLRRLLPKDYLLKWRYSGKNFPHKDTYLKNME